jgi:hypothetical protein
MSSPVKANTNVSGNQLEFVEAYLDGYDAFLSQCVAQHGVLFSPAIAGFPGLWERLHSLPCFREFDTAGDGGRSTIRFRSAMFEGRTSAP